MWSVQVNILLNNCKQNMMSLSLLAGRTVAICIYIKNNIYTYRPRQSAKTQINEPVQKQAGLKLHFKNDP